MFGRKKDEEDPVYVFECAVECNNCGFEWGERFEKGQEVVRDETDNTVSVFQEKDKSQIKCPNCESLIAKVTERRPIARQLPPPPQAPLPLQPQMQQMPVPQQVETIPKPDDYVVLGKGK